MSEKHSLKDKIIISFANTKGGSFKSTTAVALADYCRNQGKSYLIIDTDEQASVVDFNAGRPEDERLNVVGATTEKDIVEAVKNTDAEYIIIDTPGHASLEQMRNRVYELSTLIVLTVRCGGTDFNVLEKNLVKLLNSKFKDKFRVLFGADAKNCTVYKQYFEVIKAHKISYVPSPFLKYKDTDKAWLSHATLTEYLGTNARKAQKAIMNAGPLKMMEDFTSEIIDFATQTRKKSNETKGL